MFMSHTSLQFLVLSFVLACACVASEDQAYESGLPDCMNKLAKLLTTHFVFLCICLLFSLFFMTIQMMIWLSYSGILATLL